MKKKPHLLCNFDCQFNVENRPDYGVITIHINGVGPTENAVWRDARAQARRAKAALLYTLTERKWTQDR